MAGLTDEGFEIKSIAEILEDIQTAELQGISPTLDVQPTDPIGVVNGIVAAELFELWQLAEALYNGMNPDAAAGDQLTALALLSGTVRDDASKTQVTATVNVEDGFDQAAGTMFASIDGLPEAIFVNKEAVLNDGGEPQDFDLLFEAVDAGPQQCLAGTLTVISVPLSGWNSVTNDEDGAIGSEIETDSELRVERLAELSAVGSTTAAAIRADVLATLVVPTTSSNTTGCTVLYNDTDEPDANGLPPHSIEVIARQDGATDDDDEQLATLILNDKAAGIQTYGTESVEIEDSQGNAITVYFTRPEALDLYIEITVVSDPATRPADIEDQIKAVLVAYGEAEYQPGVDVYVLPLQSQVFPSPVDASQGVVSVLDVTDFKIEDNPSPTNTANIAVLIRNIATLDTSRITVTVVDP